MKTHHRRMSSLLCVASSVLASAALQAEFVIAEAEFRTQIKKVALLPARIRTEANNSQQAASQLDQLVAGSLTNASFDVIPASAFRDVEFEIATAMGGSFDIYTGKQDIEKSKTINELAIREFERIYDFDAYLITAVVPAIARFGSTTAEWDGVKRSPTGKEIGFWGALDMRGTLAASSLQVSVISKTEADTVFYSDRAGIELVTLIVGGQMTQVQPSKQLRDTAKLSEAVSSTTADLVDAPADAIPDETPETDESS